MDKTQLLPYFNAMMPYVKMGKILSESNVLCLAFLLAYDDGLKSRCVVVIVFVVVVVVVVCCM